MCNSYIKKNVRRILIFLSYFIPQLLTVRLISDLKKEFVNSKPCFSDYFLYFYDWKESSIFCSYEMIFLLLIITLIIHNELKADRVIRYQSMIKLWKNVLSSVFFISIVFPIINFIIIGIVALSKDAGFMCNWNQESSLPNWCIPHFAPFREIETYRIVILMGFLDFLRIQATIFIVLIVEWLWRNRFLDYFVTLISIIITNIHSLFDWYNMNTESIYSYMVTSRMEVYMCGIDTYNDILVPIIICGLLMMTSLALIRFYRKDMIKN